MYCITHSVISRSRQKLHRLALNKQNVQFIFPNLQVLDRAIEATYVPDTLWFMMMAECQDVRLDIRMRCIIMIILFARIFYEFSCNESWLLTLIMTSTLTCESALRRYGAPSVQIRDFSHTGDEYIH